MGAIPLFYEGKTIDTLKFGNNNVDKIIYDGTTIYDKATVKVTFNHSHSKLENTPLMEIQIWDYDPSGSKYKTKATIATDANGNVNYSNLFNINKGTKIRLIFPTVPMQLRYVTQIDSNNEEISGAVWREIPLTIESYAINSNITINITCHEVSHAFVVALNHDINIPGINTKFFNKI